MKAVLGRTFSGLSTLTRGTYNVLTFSRMRNSQPDMVDGADGDTYQEMNSIDGRAPSTSRESSLVHSYTPPPSTPITTEDDILYSKNNVYLKRLFPPSSPSSSSSPSFPSTSPPHSASAPAFLPAANPLPALPPPSHQVNASSPDKTPGFLFIASRGSNYGSTLILNWAPNSMMVRSHASINAPGITEDDDEEDSEEELEEGRDEILVSRSNGSHRNRNHSDGSRRSGPGGDFRPHQLSMAPRMPSSAPEQMCLSLDLGSMEMIRIFYHPDESGCIISGEMVVTSKQRTFWVFHFQNGGLTDLIHLFMSWKYFNHQTHSETQQHTFTIFRPKLSLSELHPLEGCVHCVLTSEMWQNLTTAEGRLADRDLVLRTIFFQGISPSLRKEVWPFLLGLYSFDSTSHEREALRLDRCKQYWLLDDMRRKKGVDGGGDRGRGGSEIPEEEEEGQEGGLDGWVVQQIDKDVIRTDRSNPYYRGEGNRHVGMLKHILLNYLVHKPDISYSQGMTDLLSPLLAALDNEVEAFWCFARLVEGTAFFKPAKDHVSVDKQLEPLRMLIKQLLPWFYTYLSATEGGLSLMFCHRWLLVCLKREFNEADTLAIWESCWTNYETTSFHLFICIAIMAIYGQRAVEKNMNINELMVFFNTLSCTMPRELVLSQARGYLHQFCKTETLHCSLQQLMVSAFWLRAGAPKLRCGVCKGMGRQSGCGPTDGNHGNREALC